MSFQEYREKRKEQKQMIRRVRLGRYIWISCHHLGYKVGDPPGYQVQGTFKYSDHATR